MDRPTGGQESPANAPGPVRVGRIPDSPGPELDALSRVDGFQPERLVLLEGDLDAQRLVVTWPVVAREGDDPEDPGTWEAWARASGVDVEEIERRAGVLAGAGILGPGGLVARDAIGYVRRRIAGGLK